MADTCPDATMWTEALERTAKATTRITRLYDDLGQPSRPTDWDEDGGGVLSDHGVTSVASDARVGGREDGAHAWQTLGGYEDSRPRGSPTHVRDDCNCEKWPLSNILALSGILPTRRHRSGWRATKPFRRWTWPCRRSALCRRRRWLTWRAGEATLSPGTFLIWKLYGSWTILRQRRRTCVEC